ncbi:MAG: DNA double-strand break repair nuclease NurA [Nanobdellota archaeon]
MDEIFRELDKTIEKANTDKAETLDESEGNLINPDNFSTITPLTTTKSLGFVDGGSSCFIESPSFCLGFIRTICVVMKNKKTEQIIHNESFVLAQATNKNDKIHFATKHFKSKNTKKELEDFEIDSLDQKLTPEQERVPVSKMIDISRRLAEIRLAIDTVKKLESGDLIILDGNLKVMYKGEKALLDELYEQAKEKEVLVLGLAKTNNTLTKNGDTLTSALLKKTDKKEWYYYPAIETKSKQHNADVYFIKLHKNSEYVFCCDIEKNKLSSIQKVMGVLAHYSNDASFPGYPYGLIKADKIARVSENETETLLTRFFGTNPSLFEKLKPYINSINAHSVLDNM